MPEKPLKPTFYRMQDGERQTIDLPDLPDSDKITVPFLRYQVEKDALEALDDLHRTIKSLQEAHSLPDFPVRIAIDRVAGLLSRKGVGSPDLSSPEYRTDGGPHGIDYLPLIGWDESNRDPDATGKGITVMVLDTAPDDPGGSQPFDYWLDLSEKIPFTGPDGNFSGNLPPEVDASHVPGEPAEVMRLRRRQMEQYHGKLIAAVVKSIAPEAEVILVKVLNDNGENLESSLRFALNYIFEYCKGTRKHPLLGPLLEPQKLVLNLSWGLFLSLYPDLDYADMLRTCQYLTELGVTIVAAAGNDTVASTSKATRKRAYPAEPAAYGYDYQFLMTSMQNLIAADKEFTEEGFPEFTEMSQVIPVAAIHEPKGGTGYAHFSDFGMIGAPGETIEMEIKQGNGIPVKLPKKRVIEVKKVVWSGSSFAAPQVAAAAALLLQAGLTSRQVKECLLGTADPRPDITGFAPPTTELDIFQNHVPKLNITRALESCRQTGVTAG